MGAPGVTRGRRGRHTGPLVRRSLRPRLASALRRFWRLAWDANITGQAAMVAYTMLLAVVPVALLGLFVAGQVLSSHAVQRSVLTDLQEVFPGAAEHTLTSLLDEVKSSTTSTGVLALIGSVWLGSSFWGSLDTAFSRIYGCRARPWLEQKRFALAMLLVVLVFMYARSVTRARSNGRSSASASRCCSAASRSSTRACRTAARRGGRCGPERSVRRWRSEWSTMRSRCTCRASRRSRGSGPRSCLC